MANNMAYKEDHTGQAKKTHISKAGSTKTPQQQHWDTIESKATGVNTDRKMDWPSALVGDSEPAALTNQWPRNSAGGGNRGDLDPLPRRHGHGASIADRPHVVQPHNVHDAGDGGGEGVPLWGCVDSGGTTLLGVISWRMFFFFFFF